MKNTFCFRKENLITKIWFLGLVFLLCSFSVTTAFGQQITVSGTVTAASDKMPLPGVSIVDVNEPTNGVVTDFDGNYQITLSIIETIQKETVKIHISLKHNSNN